MRDWPLKSWTRVPLLRDQSDVTTSLAPQFDQLSSEYRLSFNPRIKGQAYDSGDTPPAAKAGCSVKNSRCSDPDLQKTDTGFANRCRDSQTERRGSLPPNNAIRVFLNDAARFPKSCDWHMGVLPLRSGQLTATPGSVLTQQPAGDVQVDLQTVTPKHFLFHTIGSRTRTILRPVTRTWHIQEPVREFGTNAVPACRCKVSAARPRRLTNFKKQMFAIERILSGHSEPVRKRPDSLLSAHNRSACELQTIWRCPRLASITAATRPSVRELPTICCQSGNCRTQTKSRFRRLRGGRCVAPGSQITANRTPPCRRLSTFQRFAPRGAS